MLTSHSKIQIKAWHFLKPHDFIQVPWTYPSDSCATCWWVNLLHWMSLEKDRNNVPSVLWREAGEEMSANSICGVLSVQAPQPRGDQTGLGICLQRWGQAELNPGRWLDGVLHPLLVQWPCQPGWRTEQSLWETKKWSSSVLRMHCSCHEQNGSIIQHSCSKAEQKRACYSVV